MAQDNPVSAAVADNNPDAEDDFYEQFLGCYTIGELHDLTFSFMHVEGRGRKIDRRRMERAVNRRQRQVEAG